MKQNTIIVLLAAVNLAIFINFQNKPNSNDAITSNVVKGCNFPAIQGREFVFRQQSSSLQEYGYFWNKSPSFDGEMLDYNAYVGKHGKVKEKTVLGKYDSTKWFVAITDACETIYSGNHYPNDPGRNDQNPVSNLENFTGIYFLETLEKAKSMRGKEIWTTIPYGVKEARVLFTSNPDITYPRGNLQKLHVTGVEIIRVRVK